MERTDECPLIPGPGVVVIVRDGKNRKTQGGIFVGEEPMCTGIVHGIGDDTEEEINPGWELGDRVMTAGWTEYAMLKHGGKTWEVVPMGNVIATVTEELETLDADPVTPALLTPKFSSN